MLRSVDKRLSRLPPKFQPLKAMVRRQYFPTAPASRPGGTVHVAPMPWVGPETFAFVRYPPAEAAWLADFAHRYLDAIPEAHSAP